MSSVTNEHIQNIFEILVKTGAFISPVNEPVAEKDQQQLVETHPTQRGESRLLINQSKTL